MKSRIAAAGFFCSVNTSFSFSCAFCVILRFTNLSTTFPLTSPGNTPRGISLLYVTGCFAGCQYKIFLLTPHIAVRYSGYRYTGTSMLPGKRMLAEGHSCRDIIGQISALKAAVENAGKAVLVEYIEKCLEEELSRGGDYRKALKEALSLLLNSRLS